MRIKKMLILFAFTLILGFLFLGNAKAAPCCTTNMCCSYYSSNTYPVGYIMDMGTQDYICYGDTQWKYSQNYIGQIFNICSTFWTFIKFDAVSGGRSWFYCDAFDNTYHNKGVELSNNQKITISNHEYICFSNNPYETIAECCGDSGYCYSNWGVAPPLQGQEVCANPADGCRAGVGYKIPTNYVCNENEQWVSCPSYSAEVCDGIDNDCVYGADRNMYNQNVCSTLNYYCDKEGDGHFSMAPTGSCSSYNCIPSGCSNMAGDDCNDNDISIYLHAPEICDGKDNQCANCPGCGPSDLGFGKVDEGCEIAVYWTNMLEPPAIINKSDLGDSVRLVAAGSNLEGKTVSFDIYQFNALFVTGVIGFLDWLADNLVPDNKVATLSAAMQQGVAVATWQVPNSKTYYAYAQVSGLGKTDASEHLQASSQENNSAPVAKIKFPNYDAKENYVFKTNTAINFVQESYDEDDNLSYEWDFGNNEFSTLQNPSYPYANNYGGPKTVTLKASNSRNQEASDSIKILINSSQDDAPLAIISSPLIGSAIIGSTVFCNATLSIDDLTAFENLTFRWEFDDGQVYQEKGIAGALYNKTYAYAGAHWVNLSVSDE